MNKTTETTSIATLHAWDVFSLDDGRTWLVFAWHDAGCVWVHNDSPAQTGPQAYTRIDAQGTDLCVIPMSLARADLVREELMRRQENADEQRRAGTYDDTHMSATVTGV